MINNKQGITLMELLAYLTLVGIVTVLLTGTMSYAVKSYDLVNGQGAIYTEANYMMSNLITQANAFNPDYIKSCGTNCIELVLEKEKVIDPDLGLIVEVPVNKSIQIKIEENNLYIGNMKLNNNDYGVLSNSENLENSEISYACYDVDREFNTICQKFVLSFKLSIVRVNSDGAILSKKPYVFENRFSF